MKNCGWDACLMRVPQPEGSSIGFRIGTVQPDVGGESQAPMASSPLCHVP